MQSLHHLSQKIHNPPFRGFLQKTPHANETISSPTVWRRPETWEISLGQLENILNATNENEVNFLPTFNFLSNVSDEETRIELKAKGAIPIQSNSAALSAESAQTVSTTDLLNNKTNGVVEVNYSTPTISNGTILPDNVIVAAGIKSSQFGTLQIDFNKLKNSIGQNVFYISSPQIAAYEFGRLQVSTTQVSTTQVTADAIRFG